MQYLRIRNKGLLDTRIISLMGGTTKANKDELIGTFGTGLKYTLSYLLRNNILFEVFIDTERVEITTKKEVIGENTFDVIKINGKETSITTQMGRDWEAWMIIRELYANALDEGGESVDIVENPIMGYPDHTTFFIQLTNEIKEVWDKWNHYFLPSDLKPMYEDDYCRIYPQSGKMKLYKQGMLIREWEKEESVFNYDLKNAPLNELREYKGSGEYDLYTAITKFKEKKPIQYLLEHVKENDFEAQIDYAYWYGTFSEAWKEMLDGTKIIHEEAVKNIQARGIDIDTAAMVQVPKKLYEGLTKQFDGVGALRVSKSVNEFFETYNDRIHDKIMKAKAILENHDYFLEPEIKIVYGVFGDKNVLAKVDLDAKVIYVSEKHADKDLFSACTMLIEENEHFKTGLDDCSRGFQQHWIDLYTTKLLGGKDLSLV